MVAWGGEKKCTSEDRKGVEIFLFLKNGGIAEEKIEDKTIGCNILHRVDSQAVFLSVLLLLISTASHVNRFLYIAIHLRYTLKKKKIFFFYIYIDFA